MALLVAILAVLLHMYDINARYNEKPKIVLFYVNWCGYCKKFMPEWDELSNNMKHKAYFIKVDGDNNHELAKKYNVKKFPTIMKIYDNGKVVVYDKEREKKELELFCSS